MNRPLLVVLGLLLGVLGTLLILRILTVPPPAFTGASFANNAPPRKVKSGDVKIYYWTDADREKIPKELDRLDESKWKPTGTAPMTASNGDYYHSVAFKAENVVMIAVVVAADPGSSAATEKYINFVPDAALDSDTAISSVVASLENVAGEKNPRLQARFFFGRKKVADMQDLDATCYPPPVPVPR